MNATSANEPARRSGDARRAGVLELAWDEPCIFDRVRLEEPLFLGQRVRVFALEAEVEGAEVFPSGAVRHGHVKRVREDKRSEGCTHAAAVSAEGTGG